MSSSTQSPEITKSPVRVCIVDDDHDVGLTLKRVVQALGTFEIRLQTEPCDIQMEARSWRPDVVFTDLVMPEMDGFAVIDQVHCYDPDIPVIVLSGYSSLDNAVKAIKCGAFDFLPKPFTPESVEIVLAKAVRAVEEKLAARVFAEEMASRDPWLSPLVGASSAMQALRKWILKVRGVSTNILLQGETGTGKELVARAIHGSYKPFVPVNVAAVPLDIAESEFFGHRQGAFTGASTSRQGLLAEANGGTLFLDEINTMDLGLQSKLLRVIQDRRYRPVGSDQEVPADFALICASNQALEPLIEAGQFRRDLYHRIKVLSVNLPPLRERQDDIPLLAQVFLERFARQHRRNIRRINPSAFTVLKARPWDGNIRELENIIEQAVIFADDADTELDTAMLQNILSPQANPHEGSVSSGQPMTMSQMQSWYAEDILARVKNNKSEAARLLDIDYKTLLRYVNRKGTL